MYTIELEQSGTGTQSDLYTMELEHSGTGTQSDLYTMELGHNGTGKETQSDLCTMGLGQRRKLRWYGHVSRSPDLAKTILQGTVKVGTRPGRQTNMWEDNIRKWTSLEFAKSQRAVENREKIE